MHKVFENTGWLLIDKFSKLFPGILIVAFMARHLGPELFGIWNYAIALTTIVGSIALLGMDKIAVRELVNNEREQAAIVATAIFLRMVVAIGCMALSVAIVMIGRQQQAVYLYCTLFASLTIVLQSFDVLDYFYQVKNDVKKIIIPKVSVFLLFCGIKLLVVWLNGPLLALLWVTLLELLVTYTVVLVVYTYHYGVMPFLHIQRRLAKALLAHSWPLILSNLLVVLFVKVDLVLLDQLGTAAQLGAYVVAVRISEIWYAVPTILSVAMLPPLMRQQNEDREAYLSILEKWLRLSFWSSLCIALVMTCSAQWIIPLLYGDKYLSAAPILMIHIWAGIPVFLCVVVVQYLVIEGRYNIYLYSNIAGLVVNVGLNLFLIRALGGIGAAIATVAAYTSVYMTMVVFDKSGQAWALTKKMLYPQLVYADVRQAHTRLLQPKNV
ncbi:flippase [Chitinophaga agrisoli]|uniref:Flippase n=1 Tax=Chitinophaga agrisoli TaxID=2607653 RepID=A0A5B2VJY5_9BACT|nr:flippase [Chitinophaga agrisoli]KAA2239913.1 flippase [Chitinophaga agrisoli]